jgi:hypothetical protein
MHPTIFAENMPLSSNFCYNLGLQPYFIAYFDTYNPTIDVKKILKLSHLFTHNSTKNTLLHIN